MLKYAGERAIRGVAIDMRIVLKVRIMAERLHAHPRVAGDFHLSDARLRTGDHLERNVHKLLIWMRRQLCVI